MLHLLTSRPTAPPSSVLLPLFGSVGVALPIHSLGSVNILSRVIWRELFYSIDVGRKGLCGSFGFLYGLMTRRDGVAITNDQSPSEDPLSTEFPCARLHPFGLPGEERSLVVAQLKESIFVGDGQGALQGFAMGQIRVHYGVYSSSTEPVASILNHLFYLPNMLLPLLYTTSAVQ